MKYFTLILLPLCFIYSCSNNTTKAQSLKNNFTYTYDTLQRTYKDDFTKNYVGGIELHWKDSTTYVLFDFCGSSELKVIDFGSDSVFSVFFSNPQFEMVATAFKKNDLLALKENGDIIRYCNYTNNTDTLFNIFTISNLKKLGMEPSDYRPGGDQFIHIPENIFYFAIRKDYDIKGKFYNKEEGYPTVAKLDMKSKAITLFGSAPRCVEEQGYGLNSSQHMLYIGDSIVITNDWNGDISVINTLSNITITSTAKSAYDTVLIQKWSYNKKYLEGAKNAKWKHSVLSPCYEALFYNPYSGNYYRIFHPAMSEKNADGLFNTQFDKQAVLMVFDKNLQLIDEIALPVKQLRIFRLYPIKDGVAVYLPGLRTYNGEKSTTMFYLQIHINNEK